MGTTIERLATFCASTDPADVPDEVRERTKMILCDTVISGLCTFGLERGDMARDFARTMGPEPQAIVLGDTTGRKVSLLAAAYANADLMNVLDADETFFNSAHFAALSFAPALAEAERGRARGAQLLHAAAVSFDVNARLNLGTSLLELGDDGRVRFSQLSSHGYACLGAAAAIGILRGFPSDRLADAMGLATWLAPTAKNGYMGRRRRFNSLKYAPNGQIAHAGVLAALLAESGYPRRSRFTGHRAGLLGSPGIRPGGSGGHRRRSRIDLVDHRNISEALPVVPIQSRCHRCTGGAAAGPGLRCGIRGRRRGTPRSRGLGDLAVQGSGGGDSGRSPRAVRRPVQHAGHGRARTSRRAARADVVPAGDAEGSGRPGTGREGARHPGRGTGRGMGINPDRRRWREATTYPRFGIGHHRRRSIRPRHGLCHR